MGNYSNKSNYSKIIILLIIVIRVIIIIVIVIQYEKKVNRNRVILHRMHNVKWLVYDS